MQEEYRTDFCLKGSVIEINFHQYRQLIGVSNRRKNRNDSEEAYKVLPKEYIDNGEKVDEYLEITGILNPSSMHFFDEACSLVQSKLDLMPPCYFI